MKRSVAKTVSSVSSFIAVALAVFFAYNGSKAMVTVVLLALVAVVSVCNYFLRCPSCGAWPRKGSRFNKYCPECGEPLDDE